MAPHMDAKDLNKILALREDGLDAQEVFEKFAAFRRQRHKSQPNLTTVRRVLKGKTFKRSAIETRGRPKALTKANLKAVDKAREKLIIKANTEYEVTWDDVIKKSRVPSVDRTTVAKNMTKAGYDVKWRPPREKLVRGEMDEQERKDKCNKLRKLPESFWQRTVDCYMDNKKWKIPTTKKGIRFLRMTKVRGHLRKPSEGLKKGFTKPNARKHNVSVGSVNVCACIIGGKVRVWHYLPKRWCGEAAVDLYEKVVAPALIKHRGVKRSYVMLEDNDPTGYKSNAAKAAKKKLEMSPIDFPAYSPDLNPLDFSLWEEVSNRMEKKRVKNESASEYKVRLRRTALSIPEPVVRKMLGSIRARAKSIYDHSGGHIPRD
jgi:hypothetical protein